MNLLLKSPPPVELERFCVSSKNRTEELTLSLVLSGYVADGVGMQDCVMFELGRIITKEKLKSAIEESNSCLIQQHLIEAAKCESQRVVVSPTTQMM